MKKIKIKTENAKKKKIKNRFFFFLKIVGLLFLFFVSASLLLFAYYVRNFPRPEIFSERQLSESTKIYDQTGKVLLYEIYGEEKRTFVPLSEIPEHMKQAVLATEDANFYNHLGVDFRGIVRAVLADLKIGEPAFGASTIPQQLIRSTFLSLEKTPQRKTREIVLALELDRRYDKNQILEWYLNQVPFGQNTYGAEAASQTYFDKHISEISLEEAAVLTALIQSPSYLSPYGENKEKLLERKNHVLSRMTGEGYITQEQKEETKEKEISFIEKKSDIKAAYFVLWIKEQLKEKYGEDFLMKSGLKIYTSLDWEIQQKAEQATRDGIKRNKAYNAYNAGLVAIDPKTGYVLAMTSGTGDYNAASVPEGCQTGINCLFDPKFNVTIGTKESPGRQPGSSFKPFVYATAFKNGYDDKTIVVDEETNFGTPANPYIPQNYDGLFRGEVTTRQALAQSLNIPAVKVLRDLAGLENSIQTAKDFGITTITKPASFYGLPLVLGGGEVKLLEMTSAYGVFATQGLYLPPVSILRIEDANGNIIEENRKTAKRVLEPRIANIITDILSDNEARAPIFGYNSPLYFENYKVAAKTGTTQSNRDGWVIGYTPSIVVGVWVGNNNNAPMKKEPGIVVAGPIWREAIEYSLTNR